MESTKMGIARLDIGAAEVKQGGRKALAHGSKVLCEARKFEFKTSQAGNPMIKVQYEVVDENATDVDGGQEYGRLFDNIVFTEKAVKMAKLKLIGLGYEVDNLVIEDVQDVKDLAEDLKDNFTDQPVQIEVENEESTEYGVQMDRDDKKAVAAGSAAVGCIGFLVLIKLAFLALIAWGIFELVTWVVSK